MTAPVPRREKEVVDIIIALFDQEYAVKQCGNSMWAEGFAQGKNQARQLISKLFTLGKYQDVEKASNDPVYMEKLLKEYGLAET